MSEAVSLSPKSHRRLVIILLAILILVIALVVGSLLFASSKASSQVSEYQHAYADWKAKNQAALIKATATLPTGTYVLKGVEGAAVLADEEDGCGAVGISAKKAKAAADDLPKVSDDGLLGAINSDYKRAGKMSERRAKIVRAYVKRAVLTLAQLKRDCMWNIASHVVGTDAGDLRVKSERYITKNEPGLVCEDNQGCISSIAAKKNAYADLRIKAVDLDRKTSLAHLKSADCRATSYGEACRTLANSMSADLDAELAYDKFVRAAASTVGNSGIDVQLATMAKVEKKNLVANRKAVLALDPALKHNKSVVEDPAWSDNFFAAIAKLRLAELHDARAEIRRL